MQDDIAEETDENVIQEIFLNELENIFFSNLMDNVFLGLIYIHGFNAAPNPSRNGCYFDFPFEGNSTN